MAENNNNNEYLRKVHERVGQKYAVGSFDSFVESLKNPEMRKKAYDYLSNKYIMDDFSTFDNKIKGLVGDVKPTQQSSGSYIGDVAERLGAGAANFAGGALNLLQKGADIFNQYEIVQEANKLIGQGSGGLGEAGSLLKQKGEEWKAASDRYKGKTFFDLAKEGRYGEAMGDLFLGATESLPVSLGIMVTGGTGLATVGAVTASDKYDELRKQNPNMSEAAALGNSVVTGISEAVSEMLGPGVIGKTIKGLYMAGGKKAAAEAMEKGIMDKLTQFVDKHWLTYPIVEEGLTEAVNAAVEYGVDRLTGIERTDDFLQTITEAAGYGAAGGALFTPVVGRFKYMNKKRKDKATRSYNDNLPVGERLLGENLEQFNAAVTRFQNENRPEQIQNFVNEVARVKGLDNEQTRSLIDYTGSLLNYNNYINSVQDQIEEETRRAYDEIDRTANRETNTVMLASMSEGSEPVYVIGGNLVLGNDGQIDYDNSSSTIYYLDENGKVKQGTPQMFVTVVSNTPVETLYTEAALSVNERITQQEDNDIRNASFNNGDSVVLPTGETGVVQQYDDDGNLLVNIGGEIRPVAPEGVMNAEEAATVQAEQQAQQEVAEQQQMEMQYPRKGEDIDYSAITDPNMYASALQSEFGEEAGTVLDEMIADKQAELEKASKGKDAITRRRATNKINSELSLLNEARNIITPVQTEEVIEQVNDNVTEPTPVSENIEAATAEVPTAEETLPEQETQPAEQPLIPTNEQGVPQYHLTSIDNTLDDLLDGSMSIEEVNNFVDENIKAAESELKEVEKRKPKMGTSKADYLAQRDAIQEELNNARQKVEYWNNVKKEITPEEQGSQSLDKWMMEEPMNLQELAAQMLASGRLKLLQSDYKKQTGYGNREARKMFGVFASEANGGVSLEKAGEIIELRAREEGLLSENQEIELNSGFEALMDVLTGSSTKGDINSYVANNRERILREEREYQEGREAAIAEQAYGMSLDDYRSYVDATERNIRQSQITDEQYNELQGEIYDEMMAREQEFYEEIDEALEAERQRETEQEVEQEEYIENEPREFDSINQGSDGVLPETQINQEGRSNVPQESEQTAADIVGENGATQGNEVASAIRQDENLLDFTQRVVDADTRAKEEQKVEQNPTDAQKEAGNYKKGHIKVDGLDITIEQPKGSVRSGKDRDGKKWSVTMNNTYGYIRGTKGVDGDHIDVFLSDDTSQGNVYVVDQINSDGSFDEHKVMYGFPDIESAKNAYLSNYSQGWKGLGNITEVSKEDFKKWIDSSVRKSKPFAEYKGFENNAKQTTSSPIQETEMEMIDRIAQEQKRKQRGPEKQKQYDRAKEWESKVGVPVEIMENINDVSNAQAREAISSGKVITGWYDVKTGKVYIYLPNIASEAEIDRTYIHEIVAHKGLRGLLGDKFDSFMDNVWDSMSEQDQTRFMNYPGVKNKRDAADEYVAFLSESTDLESKSVWDKIVSSLKDFLRDLGINISMSDADIREALRDSYRRLKSEVAQERASVDQILENEDSLNPEVQDIKMKGDEVVSVENDDNGQVLFSIRTYEESGRKNLEEFAKKQVENGDLTQEQANEIVSEVESMYQISKKYKDQYEPFSQWSDAEVSYDKDGRMTFSVIKPNGEYAMNLDFSLVCKKRRTLDAVLNELIGRGVLNNINLGMVEMAKVNDVIRQHGFETACRLCFVDAKRFRVAKVADDFCKIYNALVRKIVPKDQREKVEYFNYGSTPGINEGRSNQGIEVDLEPLYDIVRKAKNNTVTVKAARHLIENPADRKYVQRSDFMSTQGFDKVKEQNPLLMNLYNSKKGSGGPKASFGDVQYMNDIQDKKWNIEDAYAVGGVRLQSFSDYVPRLVLDYIQMVGDLAAKNLPVHSYTKEELFVKMFGLTGIKINMSLVPTVVEDGIAPGLDANGNYVWEKGETFDFDEAVKIQNTEGYRENCGTIAVGVSDEQIRKMMEDPNIRMIIPYHKSGINKAVAVHNNISKFKDYTKTQNTRYKDGVKLSKSDMQAEPNFNELLREHESPVKAAGMYLEWCKQNGYLPKFDQFAYNEDGSMNQNYYKLLEDFTTLVPTETGYDYYPQRGVTTTFPKEGAAFGSAEDLIKRGLEEDAVLEGNRKHDVSMITDEVIEVLTESETNQDQATDENGVRFREVTDPKEIEFLENQDKVKVYRAMQVIDGKLYPPMAAAMGGKLIEPIELNKWEKAVERPELAIPDIDSKTGKQKVDKKTGELVWKFVLDKGGKDATGKKATPIPARYNPYIHTSRSPLNDQFKSAWIRPNLVTVEVEVPVSELTSGYKAERAKDAVGEVEWKSGSVSGELAKVGKTRRVILSRWDKPVRVLDNSEVTERIAELIGDNDIAIPENVVTPQLRVELEKRGVKIGDPEKGVNKNEQVQEALKSGLLTDNSLVRFREATFTPEEQQIISDAQANGTYMKAPNGNDTNLTEKQWAQVRTKAFKDWFGDWEGDPENASKVVDENGEPMVVYHGSRTGGFSVFDDTKGDKGSDAPSGSIWFSSSRENAYSYSGVRDAAKYEEAENSRGIYECFLNIRDPYMEDFEGASWDGQAYGKVEMFEEDEYGEAGDTVYNDKGGRFFDSKDEAREYADRYGIENVYIQEDPYLGMTTNEVAEMALNEGNDGAIIYNVLDSGSYAEEYGDDYIVFSPNQIKSATDNTGAFSAESDDIRFRAQTEKRISGGRKISFTRANPTTTFNALTRWINNLGIEPKDINKARTGSKYVSFDKEGVEYSVRASNHTKGYYGSPDNNNGVEVSWSDKIDGVEIDLAMNEMGISDIQSMVSEVEDINKDLPKMLDMAKNREMPSMRYGVSALTVAMDKHVKDALLAEKRKLIGNVYEEYGITPQGYIIHRASNGVRIDTYANGSNNVQISSKVEGGRKNARETALNEYVNSGEYDNNLKKFKDADAKIKAASEEIDSAIREAATLDDMRYRVNMSASERKQAAVNELSSSLNTPVTVYNSLEEIVDENPRRQRMRRSSKGWYNTETGEVVVVIPNNTNAADVQATVMHEIVGYKGLRGLLGDNFDTMMDNIYRNVPENVRQSLALEALRSYNGNVRTATEEYLARIAERGVSEPLVWDKIKSSIKEVFRNMGINLVMSDEDIAYLFWKSKNRLNKGDSFKTMLDKAAKDAEMRSTLLYRNSSMRNGTMLNTHPTQRVSVRNTINTLTSRLTPVVKNGYKAFREGYQDRMLPLRDFQEAITEETGHKVADFENAYVYENTIQSKAQYDSNKYKDNVLNPLVAEVAKLSKVNGKVDAEKSRLVESYMMIKHGLERNALMRKRDLDKIENPSPETIEKFNNRDYSGLTALSKEVLDLDTMDEAALADWVNDFEKNNDTSKLWSLVKDATEATLDKLYQSNMLSRDKMNELKGMYKYYIPLKEWDETTAGEVFDYVEKGYTDKVSNPIKKAKGRTSRAGSVLANIVNDFDNATILGYKNLMKLRLANLVRNSKTNKASVSNMWYVKALDSEGNEVWEPAVPEGLTEDAAKNAEIIADFEEKMQGLAKTGDAKHSHEVLELGMPIKNWQERQHMIRVKESGRDMVVYINGDPKVSQSVNGLNRANFDNYMLQGLNWVKRNMMLNYTSRNINFVARNFIRDMVYTNTMNFVKYGPKFELEYVKNIVPALNALSRKAMAKKAKNAKQQDLFDAIDAFERGGGKTGYVEIVGYDKYKREVDKLLRKSAGGNVQVKDVINTVGSFLEQSNDVIENTARFATYLTAKKVGMTELQAIKAAKDVSVNFNRKGSGAMGGVYFQNFYFFFNAAIQGTHNFLSAVKAQPKRAAAAMAMWGTMGFAYSMLMSLLMGDDDEYNQIPDYVRQNNLLIPIPSTEKFALIPLPVELRILFGAGDMFAQASRGEYKGRDFTSDMIAKIMEFSPKSFEGNLSGMSRGLGDNPLDLIMKNFTPDAVRPVIDALYFNENFFGKRVSGRNEFNKYVPEFQKVTTGTSKALIKASEKLNEVTGGDYATKGSIDPVLLNPSIAEYLFEQYFGGIGKLISQIYKTSEGAFGDGAELRNIPVVSGLSYDTTNLIPRDYTQQRYEKFIEFYEEAQSRKRMYEKGLFSGEELSENFKAFVSDKDYAKYNLIDRYKKIIDSMYDKTKIPMNDDEKKRIFENVRKLKKEMVKQIDKIDNEE